MKRHPASSVKDSFDTLKQENMAPSISKVDNVHNEIQDAINMAKAEAELRLDAENESIMLRQQSEGAIKGAQTQAARDGDYESAQQFINKVQIK